MSLGAPLLSESFRLAFPYLVKLHHAIILEMFEHRNGFSGHIFCCLAGLPTWSEPIDKTFRIAAWMSIYQTGDQAKPELGNGAGSSEISVMPIGISCNMYAWSGEIEDPFNRDLLQHVRLVR